MDYLDFRSHTHPFADVTHAEATGTHIYHLSLEQRVIVGAKHHFAAGNGSGSKSSLNSRLNTG